MRPDFAQVDPPTGVYVTHDGDGILFVHRGYYTGGIIRFKVDDDQVTLTTPVFHPLVDLTSGRMALSTRATDLTTLLHTLKAAFKRAALDSVLEKDALNREAWRLYRNSPQVFHKLAQQSAKITLDDALKPRQDGIVFRSDALT